MASSNGPTSSSSSILSPPRRPTARMRPISLTRAKNAQKRAQKMGERRGANSTNNSTNEGRHPNFQIKRSTGDCPRYNDLSNIIEDPYTNQVYMYGGVLYGAKDDNPTSDFSICDVSNMRWTNLTYRLNWIHHPHDRFSTRSEEPLPCISSPGATLLRMRNSSYIAIVGGFDDQTQKARSGIILVDPTAREWWNLDIQGTAPGPRISPAVVAVGSRIYVFGGYRRFGDDPQPYYSYSIAEHLADKGVWSWSTCDEPYSSAVPVGLVFQEACAVYNGAKILLTPGRLTDSEHINFTPENNIFFHTEHNKFQPATADITGTFPSNVRWYSLSRPSVAISAFDSTVIICCFIDVPGTDDVAPEVWRLSLTPHEKIDSLNIMRKIWDLNSDFQGAICVGGKVRLMGWDQVRKDARWNTFLDILWNQ